MHCFAALLITATSLVYFGSATGGSELRQGRTLAEGAAHSQPRSALRGSSFLAKSAPPEIHRIYVDKMPVHLPEMPLPSNEGSEDMDATPEPLQKAQKALHDATVDANDLFKIVTVTLAAVHLACAQPGESVACTSAKESLSDDARAWHRRSEDVIKKADNVIVAMGNPDNRDKLEAKERDLLRAVESIKDALTLCGLPKVQGHAGFILPEEIPEVTFRTLTAKDLTSLDDQDDKQALIWSQHQLCVALEHANTRREHVALASSNFRNANEEDTPCVSKDCIRARLDLESSARDWFLNDTAEARAKAKALLAEAEALLGAMDKKKKNSKQHAAPANSPERVLLDLKSEVEKVEVALTFKKLSAAKP